MNLGLRAGMVAGAHRGWAVGTLVLLLIAAVPVRATITNGGFEDAPHTWVQGVGPAGWTVGGGIFDADNYPADPYHLV